MNKISYALIALLIPTLIVAYGSLYRVNETEQVIVTQFGKPVGDIVSEAGLKLKVPFIQKVNRIKREFCYGMATLTTCPQKINFILRLILLPDGVLKIHFSIF
jgi:membrane protease subunit HflC